MVTRVWGYRMVQKATGQLLDTLPLHLPPLRLSTLALGIDLCPQLREEVLAQGWNFLGSVHSAQHALLALLPLLLRCDSDDVGTECPSPYQVQAPRRSTCPPPLRSWCHLSHCHYVID